MKRAFLAMSVFAAALFTFPNFSGWFARHVSMPLLDVIGRISTVAAFPVIGLIAVAFVLSACLARPRFFAAAFAAAALYCILWLPVEFAYTYEIPDVEQARLDVLCGELVNRLNETGRVTVDAALVPGIAKEAMGASAAVKAARYPEWLRALRLAGIYIPFTGEAIIDATRPASGLIFTAAHELAHAAGVGDEAHANIAAYTACVSFGGAAEYSANLWALKYALGGEKVPGNLDTDIACDLMNIPYSGHTGGNYALLANWLCSHIL